MLVIAEVAGRGRRRTEEFQGWTRTADRSTLVRGGRRTDGTRPSQGQIRTQSSLSREPWTIGSQFPIGKVGFAKVVLVFRIYLWA